MDEDDGDKLYTIESLIMCLEEIRKNGEGSISFPRALYCLAYEIKAMKRKVFYDS